ncbi:hypothetical protein MC7420_4810 [Coleofasciculus chthonoplastes PCC 7420]|uniref:Uncharacterized protein n=1 Tax=Coleofasciculus chthonoplastes PCC 7420 TaxID=118168 RepID=B4VNJ1_9CYAN|nr:hypothetical protein [Coleofasciculus chthonoplastes]EDX76554.1 hypothetical protein MC7420_4810 [Coleofasciculus chthonoplastes PCC 7420]
MLVIRKQQKEVLLAASSKEPKNPGEECLQQLAKKALDSLNKKASGAKASEAKDWLIFRDPTTQIFLGSQRDSALMLKSAAIHPLQPLENVHQRMVREVGRSIENSDIRQQKEQAKLNEFFPFDAGNPQPMTTENVAGEDDNFSTDQLLTARMKLVKIVRVIKNEIANVNKPNDTIDNNKFASVKQEMKSLVDEFDKIIQRFQTNDISQIPILDLAQKYLNNRKSDIEKASDWQSLKKLSYDYLYPAVELLNRALNGLARVQMFYNIEPFYLFRLLVVFRLESNEKISEDDKRKVSGDLTGLLNNKRDWLENWLKQKLRDLDAALQNDKDVFFHLKGGRAVAYLTRKPDNGENDWDTSIVINPHLEADEWYKKFNQVHNLVLQKLNEFKREFFVLVHENADKFNQSLSLSILEADNVDAIDEYPDEHELADDYDERDAEPLKTLVVLNEEVENESRIDLFPKYVANCKAELIDIGIPRRDTIEAFEQWSHTKSELIKRKWTEEIPIPSHLYYIDEYVRMIREALTNMSSSMPKTPKRIRRLYEILDGGYDDGDNNEQYTLSKLIDKEWSKINSSICPKAVQIIKNNQNQAIKRVLTVILQQFMQAYELNYRVELARIFDQFFEDKSKDVKPKIEYLPELEQAIDEDDKFDESTHRKLLQWIDFAESVSTKFEYHFIEKAKFWGFSKQSGENGKPRRKSLESFVKALYTGSIFSPEQELEVQFVITGSFAAYLYADYASSDKLAELDPVDTIEMKLLCYPKRDDIDKNHMEALLKLALNKFISDDPNHQFSVEYREGGLALVSWHKEETIGAFTYKPLVAKITIDSKWSQLAFIWGFPVISLRDLIREYDTNSAEAEEFGAKQRLRRTSSILKEILTKYD